MKMISNRFGKKCSQCKIFVGEAEGFATKVAGKWITLCKSNVCIEDAGVEVPSDDRLINEQGQIFMPYEADSLPILRGMPKARFDRENTCWVVSLETRDRSRVMEGVKRLNLSFPEGFDIVQHDASVIDAVSRAKNGGAYDYQLEGVKFLASHDQCLLADDMGLGKTLQSLMAIEEGGRAIVICPATIKINWANEVKKWRSDLTPIVCKGRKGFVLPAKDEVVIINYDILPKEFTPTDKWGQECDVSQEWREILAETTLIADEAHLCKSHKAIRSKRTKILSSLCKKTWAMTGTPLLSKGFDLWGVVSTFGMGREIFGGFKGFTKSMNAYKNYWGGWEFGTPDPSVPEKMRRVMLRRLKTEVLTSLPPKTYQDILVGCSKSLEKLSKKALESLKEYGVGELPHFSEFSTLRAELASSRIPALTEMVESFEDADEPIVVFSAHRAPIEAMGERDGWEIIMGDTPQSKRQEVVEAFQAGLLKGIACTIKAGGVGITLTRASKMIFCDQEWNPALNLQAEDRICRIGQEADSLQYIRLVTDCDLDLHVLNLLDRKKEMIQNAIENEVSIVASTSNQVIEETREERDERIKEIVKAQAIDTVKNKRERLVDDVIEVIEVDEEKVFDDITFLLNRCDGAQEKDGAGFNKPDSIFMNQIIEAFDYVSGDKELLTVVFQRLTKYKKQLSER